MRISKEKAENIAVELTKPLAAKITETKEALRDKALLIAESKIPKQLSECFAKYSDKFHTHSKAHFSGVGLPRYTYISLGKALPGYSKEIELTEPQSRVICKLLDAVSNAEKKYEETKTKITNTLIGLGTYNRIKEQIPEVEKYLPIQTSTALTLPIKEVRKEIKTLEEANN